MIGAAGEAIGYCVSASVVGPGPGACGRDPFTVDADLVLLLSLDEPFQGRAVALIHPFPLLGRYGGLFSVGVFGVTNSGPRLGLVGFRIGDIRQ